MRLAIAFGLMAALVPVAAGAEEPLPLPSVDYAAEGTFVSGGKMVVRHHAGMMRLDANLPGVPIPMTGYFDLPARKATMIVATPAGRMAMEVSLADQAGYGALSGSGEREGKDTVAGESCSVWRIATGKHNEQVRSCITDDGIVLRTATVNRDRVHTVFELTTVTRAPQAPEQFRVPTDVPVIRAPAPAPPRSAPRTTPPR